jgi:hypothetical protein
MQESAEAIPRAVVGGNQNRLYMKGAMMLLSVNRIKALSKRSMKMIGRSQYRFLIFRNSQSSLMID